MIIFFFIVKFVVSLFKIELFFYKYYRSVYFIFFLGLMFFLFMLFKGIFVFLIIKKILGCFLF